jgi:DNA-binding NarL/FixJ family response regulator
MKAIRVFIVDDNFIARRGLRSTLESEEDISVVGEASTGVEAIRIMPASGVDVVLMDIRMPDVNGIETTARLLGHNPELKILMLTVVDDPFVLAGALAAGAGGYLVYGHFTPDQLVEAVFKASAGETVCLPSLPDLLPEEARQLAEGKGAGEVALTHREAGVLDLIAAGKENREIAETLRIEEKTVKNHINSIYSKLGISNRQQAVWYVLSTRFRS